MVCVLLQIPPNLGGRPALLFWKYRAGSHLPIQRRLQRLPMHPLKLDRPMSSRSNSGQPEVVAPLYLPS